MLIKIVSINSKLLNECTISRRVMKTIIRGGQLFLHNTRMLKQVLWLVLIIPMLFCMIMNILLAHRDLSEEHFDIAYDYLLARTLVDAGLYDTSINSINYDGAYTKGRVNKNGKILKLEVPALTVLNARIMDWLDIQEILWHNFYISLIPTAIFIFSSIFICYRYGESNSSDHIIHGQEVISSKELRKIIKKDNKKHHSYNLASIPYPKDAEYRHTIITGSTGTGKTLLISELVKQIRERGDRAIIYDKTGIYTERFMQKGDILLNPLDKRSATWSILQEVTDAEDFYNIAASLIPMSNRTEDKFWIASARTVFAEICIKLWQKNPQAKNSELVNILLKQSKSYIEQYLRNTTAINLISGDGNKTAESILGIMSSFTHCLKYLPDGEAFSLDKWLKQEDGSALFLTSHHSKHNAIMPLLVGWLELAITHTLSKPPATKQKTWFIIDEASSLHKIPGLTNALSMARQYGGCFVIGLQSINQFRNLYGNEADIIDDLCNNKVILQTGGYASAEYYSKILGEIEIEKTTEGISYGANTMRDGVNISSQKERKRVVNPTAITELKVREGYIKFGNTYPVAKIEIPIIEYKTKNAQIIPKNNILPAEDLPPSLDMPTQDYKKRKSSTYIQTNDEF